MHCGQCMVPCLGSKIHSSEVRFGSTCWIYFLIGLLQKHTITKEFKLSLYPLKTVKVTTFVFINKNENKTCTACEAVFSTLD